MYLIAAFFLSAVIPEQTSGVLCRYVNVSIIDIEALLTRRLSTSVLSLPIHWRWALPQPMSLPLALSSFLSGLHLVDEAFKPDQYPLCSLR